MKTRKLLFLWLLVSSASCEKQEVTFTGNLVVTAQGISSVNFGNGPIPIDQVKVGLYDMSVLISHDYTQAILLQTFNQGKVKFNDINFGNYVVSDYGGSQKIVQIKAGQTTSIDLFAH